jgi:Holliday junction resolvase
MYNRTTLKEKVIHSAEWVECPVKDCSHQVPRQKKTFKTTDVYLCPTHNIFLSPTTFEYTDYTMNLLTKDPEDIQLLKTILKKKRENRLARSNSEDAVTWNMFRYLESNNLLEGYLESIGVYNARNPQIHYWCFDGKSQNTYPLLLKARSTFGEKPSRGSEPDILIETENAIILIECKTGSGNNTTPTRLEVEKLYTEADNWFFTQVFNAGFHSIAVKDKKYELLRFWLLGLWMAKQKQKNFYLYNLVREEKERNIEHEFGKHLIPGKGTFKRTTWEDMYHYIKRAASSTQNIALDYLENQTLGYTSSGKLKRGYRL